MCVEVGLSEGYNRKKLGPEDKPLCGIFYYPIINPGGNIVYIGVALAFFE
jgi:hypothetical protein